MEAGKWGLGVREGTRRDATHQPESLGCGDAEGRSPCDGGWGGVGWELCGTEGTERDAIHRFRLLES